MDGSELAVRDNHQWIVQKSRFSRFDVEQPVDIYLRSAGNTSRPLGPYAHFSCVDGISYVEQHIFAFYDEQNRDWYIFSDGLHWKTIVVTAASRLSRR